MVEESSTDMNPMHRQVQVRAPENVEADRQLDLTCQ